MSQPTTSNDDETLHETMNDVISRHQKELKSFEGEKRSALKKVKGTAGKGKKGKELLAATEKEYEEKLKALKEKHNSELSEFKLDTSAIPCTGSEPESSIEQSSNLASKEKSKPKKSKAQRKREKARLAEKEREAEIAKEQLQAGPSPRQLEIQRITELYLNEKNLTLREIQADGNCLYRAIASQCSDIDYKAVRNLCAEVLTEHDEEFSPFAEIDTTYEEYVFKVASSSEWGGHLELRALAMGLKRPIVVYSADAPPLVLGEEYKDLDDSVEEILLSFHRHYYALGEHYNSVVPILNE